MKISVYTMAVETFVPTLESLATLLEKERLTRSTRVWTW